MLTKYFMSLGWQYSYINCLCMGFMLVTAGTNTKRLFGKFDEDRPEPGGHLWPGLHPHSEPHLPNPQEDGGPQVSRWARKPAFEGSMASLPLRIKYILSFIFKMKTALFWSR